MKRLLIPVAALTPVLVAVLLMVLFAPATAFSQNNPPPAGGSLTLPSVQILDLSGQPLPGGGNGETYVQYTADFTATQTNATITFAFRDDVADISFANVSVVDVTADSAVPLANNDFSQGVVGSTPTSWTWANISATGYEGVVQTGSSYCYTELYCWYDGSSQGYDTISQAITTVVGHNYQISFFVAENSFCSTNGNGLTCNFSDISSASSPKISGTDVVVYVAGGTPLGTQTLTLALLDGGTGTVTDNLGANGIGTCYEAAGIVYQNGVVQTSGTCTATVQAGTQVTLTAAPDVPSPTTPSTTFGAPASGQVLAIPGWGGVCSPTKTNPLECNLTMNSAESVTAAFVVQGQAAAETLTTSLTTFPFNGGYNGSGGFDFTGQLTQGSSSTTGVVNAVPINPEICNFIIDAAFQNAYCFVYQLGSTPNSSTDMAQMFELTCPQLPGGTCGSVEAATFFAALSSDFTFDVTSENPGLTTPIVGGNEILEYDTGNPYVGVVKFEGPDPYHPCYLPTGQTAPSPTNQVISFNFVDPGAKPATGGSAGTASCWLIAYNMPNEAPTVSITSGPTNNQDIPLNTPLNAAFTCTAVNTNPQNLTPPPVPYGPFLTVNSCTLTDTYTGAGNPATITATPGSASTTDSGAIDTSNPGPHTLVATVMDSAENTISTSTITYNVQGSSSTVVSSSPNPSTYGQLVTFTATVTGARTPTGQVTWTGIPDCVAATPLNSSGVATCTTSSLAASGTPYPVTTSYSGDNYNSTSPGTLVGGQTVNPASQSITFTTAPPANAAYNSNFNVAATASSNLTVSIVGSGSCSGSGSGSATITMTSGTGTCTVTASQAGNSNYLAAPTLTPTVNATLVAQTITFTTAPPANAAYNSNFNVAATASSNLTVSIVGSGSCSGSGSGSATITMTSGTGTCTVTASQAGNSNYLAAPTLTPTVNATLVAQTITFTTAPPANAAYNSNFNVAATASSNLTVSIVGSGSCGGSGSGSATITMTSGTGTCTVTASQAGNSNYLAAPTLTPTVNATLVAQTITFTTAPPANAAYNSNFNVAATASSNLTVSIVGSGSCGGSGSGSATITMTSGTGTCTVTASQAGNSNYSAAPTLAPTVNATLVAQTITFTTAPPANAAYNSNFNVAATASSNLTVSIVGSGSCGGSGSGSATITMTSGTGTCTVTASQAGNSNYSAAPTLAPTVNATLVAQTITFTTAPPANAAYKSNFNVAATASSNLTVSIVGSGSCSGSGSGSATITMTSGTGTCTVTASQAGNSNYSAAPTLAPTLNATLGKQTITVTTPPPASATYGSNFPVAATASSGLGVAITSSGSCSGSGTGSATITITSSTGTCSVMFNQAGNSNYSAAPTVTDSVTVGPPVTLTPSTVNFPTTKAGKTSTAQVTLTNTGNVTLTNISVKVSESDSDEFTATSCPSTLAAGAKCTITVTYYADSDDRGGTTAKLVVKDSAPSPYNQLVTILNGKSD